MAHLLPLVVKPVELTVELLLATGAEATADEEGTTTTTADDVSAGAE